jgi:argininosuccinate lyase
MVKRFVAVTSALLIVAAGAARLSGQTPAGHDAFYYMTLMNKASVVMLAETGIVPRALGAKIAAGIQQVDGDQAKPGAKRPADYLVFEADLLKAAGSDASRLHTGRSRQDMGSTSGRMFLREGLLDTFEKLNHARDRVLALAALHQKTIIPAYTHGVQAQPTSLAHYLLAFDAAMQRDGERFRAAYADINLSPLGAAALGTSGFALDRKRLAALLGFDGVVDNSYDANHWSPQETNIDLSNVVATSAIGVGHFVQDLHTQYHQPVPWILLKEGPLTGISSIMPQKRNPSALEQLREISSTVIGDAQTVYFVEHNATTGMNDYRGPQHALQAARAAQRMYALLADVVDDLDVRVDRALDEVNRDYSTMTEVADSLLRIANVPFRIGHHFASELTNYGRSHGQTPKEIAYVEAQRIYKEATDGQALPLTEAQFKEALSAENMVFNRHGLGGPQLSETSRMLTEHRGRLAADSAWTKAQRDRIAAATAALDKAFNALMTTASQ